MWPASRRGQSLHGVARVCLGLMGVLGFLSCGGGGGGATGSSPGTDVLLNDFSTWSAAMPGRHPDLYFKQSKTQYDQMVLQLKTDAPNLSQGTFLARWQAIVAAIGDEHTWFQYPEKESLRLPIRTWRFPDGIYVINADQAHRDLVGSRMDTLGSLQVSEVQERLRPYVTYSLEPYFQRGSGESIGKSITLLQDAGIIPSADHYLCGFTKADGTPISRDLATVRSFKAAYTSALLRDEEPGSNYFLRENLAQGVVYVRYRSCAEMAAHPMSVFCGEVIAALQQASSRKLVLDLRGNGGGNSSLIQPLFDWLENSPFNDKDRLLVLVDSGVFSSAFLNAATCKFTLSGTLLGDTIGQAFWQYGNVVQFPLPSGRMAYHSTQLYQWGPSGLSDPFRAPFEPDVRIVETIGDFRAGYDPVLAEALK